MTIPNAPRLGTCRQAMRKERERKREQGQFLGDHVLDLQIPTHFHEFPWIFDEDRTTKDEATVVPWKGKRDDDLGIRLRERTVPGARCKHTVRHDR